MLEKELKGEWRILTIDQWDKKFIDLIEPGCIEFMDNGFGSFHFGCVYANIDYRINKQNKTEFSFYGDDEGQEVFGRGWVKIDDTGLYGEILFHEGDECVFQAVRKTSVKPQEIFKRRLKSHSIDEKKRFA